MTVRAITTAHLPGNQTVFEGDIYPDDDPVVSRYPQFFQPTDVVTEHRAVLDATARPGARRGHPTPPTSSTAPAGYPDDGSIDDVLAWVGNDPDRARVAQQAETAGKKRKGLLGPLDDLLADAG